MRVVVDNFEVADLGKVRVVALKDQQRNTLSANVEHTDGRLNPVISNHRTIFEARDAYNRKIVPPTIETLSEKSYSRFTGTSHK